MLMFTKNSTFGIGSRANYQKNYLDIYVQRSKIIFVYASLSFTQYCMYPVNLSCVNVGLFFLQPFVFATVYLSVLRYISSVYATYTLAIEIFFSDFNLNHSFRK
jgi:hypothetical protein